MTKFPIVISGFLVGICLSLLIGSIWTLVAFGLALTLLLWWQGRPESLITAIFIAGATLGLARGALLPASDHKLDQFLGQTASLTGIVVEAPDLRDDRTRLVLKTEVSTDRLIITVPRYPAYDYGDKLLLKGKLSLPDNFITSTGRKFNYRDFLALRGVYYEMSFPAVERVATRQGSNLLAKLYGGREFLIRKIEAVLPEPESSLLAGILLGAKQSLGTEWLKIFRRAGISHIIVLSGYNVTIVAEGLARVLGRLPRLAGLGAGALGLILFTAMVGGGASIVRAALMALLVILARVTGRLYSANRALIIAIALMVGQQPLILFYDVGFQLSVLATFALINLAPKLESRLTFLPERFGFRGVVATTLATQIFVLPWLVYQIGEISLIALPVNLLILPLMPLTMLGGFVMLGLAIIWPPLAWPVAFAVRSLLAYDLTLAQTAARLPGAAISLPPIPLGIIVLLYGSFLLAWLVILKKR